MDVETRLVILHIDFSNGVHKCLLDGGKLPSSLVFECHPADMGPSILTKYLEIEPEWVSFVLVSIEYEAQEDRSVLAIYYGCMIPNIIKNLQGSWQDIGEIDDGDIQRIVFEAGQKILAKF